MKHVYTTGQVARICGVSQQAVIKWFDSGRLQGYRVPDSRDRRIPRENLVGFMQQFGIPLSSLDQVEEDDRRQELIRRQTQELRDLRQKNRELAALWEITSRLYSPFELDDLLGEIMAACRNLLDAEAASVLLIDDETGKLHFYWVQGGSEQEIKEICLEPGQGIAGWCAQTGEDVLVEDARSDPRFFADVDKKTRFVTRSVICVPVRVDTKVIGVVEVLNKVGGGVFQKEDMDVLRVLASQIAQAIDKVRKQSRLIEQERLATIGSMAGAIIHDLKNPMTIIKGFAYLLKKKDADNAKYCDYITQEIDRLVSMSRELLDYSRGELKYTFIPVDFGNWIRKLAELVQHDLEDRRIRLDLEAGYQGSVEIDPDKMYRVLMNLVVNAREAMGAGGTLRIATRLDDGWLAVDVQDSGCGMSPEVQKNLFRPFFTHGKERGTGLGLAIVKNIITAHGGTITVQSAAGQGSVFSIRLPLTGAQVGRAAQIRSTQLPGQVTPEPATTPAGSSA